MSLTKISALAEIVSSVAILVTLVYLAIEMRQNTVATQGVIRQEMLADDRELILTAIEFPITQSGRFHDLSELSDDEIVQLGSFLIAFTRSRESQWLQYQNGVIDETTWYGYREALKTVLSSELTRSWWLNRISRGEYDQGFVDNVNELLADAPIIEVRSMSEQMGFE